MGWTYTRREPHQKHIDFFRTEFDGPHHQLLDISGTLGTLYGAMRVSRPEQEPFVIGLVVLTNWRHGDRLYNFGWKDMSEEMGPCEARAPRRILDLLTPLDEMERRGIFTDGSARNWRTRCEENLARRSRLRLKKGMIIRTPHLIRFTDGQEHDTFEITEPRRLRATATYDVEEGGQTFTFSHHVYFGNRNPILEAQHVADAWPRQDQ